MSPGLIIFLKWPDSSPCLSAICQRDGRIIVNQWVQIPRDSMTCSFWLRNTVLGTVLKGTCKLLGAIVSISFGFMDRLQRLDQSLEVGLHYMASQNPSSWSKVLFWIELALNTWSSLEFPLSTKSMSITLHCFYLGEGDPCSCILCHDSMVLSSLVQAKCTLLKTSAAYKKACCYGCYRFTVPSTSARSSRWRIVVSILVPPWQHSSNLLMFVLFPMFILVCTLTIILACRFGELCVCCWVLSCVLT